MISDKTILLSLYRIVFANETGGARRLRVPMLLCCLVPYCNMYGKHLQVLRPRKRNSIARNRVAFVLSVIRRLDHAQGIEIDRRFQDAPHRRLIRGDAAASAEHMAGSM
jgi:hypothetical protein